MIGITCLVNGNWYNDNDNYNNNNHNIMYYNMTCKKMTTSILEPYNSYYENETDSLGTLSY